jgi:hypothetical protein
LIESFALSDWFDTFQLARDLDFTAYSGNVSVAADVGYDAVWNSVEGKL